MIHIIDDTPDIYITRSEYARQRYEYDKAMMHYAGPPIPFEDWLRQRRSFVMVPAGGTGKSAG